MRKLLQVISLGVLVYLLFNSFSGMDFATAKHNVVINYQKSLIDSTKNIDSVKQAAREYLNTLRTTQNKYSDKSEIHFWLLLGFFIIQIFIYRLALSRRK